MSTLRIQPSQTTVADPSRSTVIGPGLTIGFFAAAFLWTTWFVTHLPWLGLSQQVALPIMLGVWLGAFVWGGTYVRHARVAVGAMAGAVSAVLGLLILFSMIGGKPDGGGPNTSLVIAGFLVSGVVVGVAGVVAGGVLSRHDVDTSPTAWLSRFSKVAVLATAPLLFIGGLVTSTQSGMAVPDWPTTFGMNMFLYPLGPRVEASVFFEHSHRLFGTLVGATTLTLAVLGYMGGPTSFVRKLSVGAFWLVVCQGVLGGARVIENKTVLAMLHGILAQLTFATLVVLAVHLSSGYRVVANTPVLGARRAKFFATLAMHSLLLQLVLGAAYRHLRHDHILYTHAAFAFVVTFGGFMAAALVWGLRDARTSAPLPGRGLLSKTALWVAASIIVQFLLGWFAFGFGGKQMEAASVSQALIRTVHQANGAVVLGSVTAMFVAVRAAFRASRDVAVK